MTGAFFLSALFFCVYVFSGKGNALVSFSPSLFSWGFVMSMETGKRCDMACEILHATEDGDGLHPSDLCLVEDGVNGGLTAKGEKAFFALHEQVTGGKYRSPFDAWFHGIENMKIDGVGYVTWRGKKVEHYTPGWCWGAEAKKCAEQLEQTCKFLEARGDVPSWSNIFRAMDELFPAWLGKAATDGVVRVDSVSELKKALRS